MADSWKILWVDDEIEMLRPHILFLEERGYTIRSVTNGIDAIASTKQDHFDLILLDERMPGMDGIATLTEIKKHAPAPHRFGQQFFSSRIIAVAEQDPCLMGDILERRKRHRDRDLGCLFGSGQLGLRFHNRFTRIFEKQEIGSGAQNGDNQHEEGPEKSFTDYPIVLGSPFLIVWRSVFIIVWRSVFIIMIHRF